MGTLGERRGIDDASQIATHQHHIAGLDGNIGASADRNAHVGLGQSGRIIDPVPHKSDALALRLETPDLCRFLVGQYLSENLLDANLSGDSIGSGTVIAGEHGHFQPLRFECCDSVGRALLEGIRHRDDCSKLTVYRGIERALGVLGQHLGACFCLAEVDFQPTHVTISPYMYQVAVDLGFNAVDWLGTKATDRG